MFLKLGAYYLITKAGNLPQDKKKFQTDFAFGQNSIQYRMRKECMVIQTKNRTGCAVITSTSNNADNIEWAKVVAEITVVTVVICSNLQ